LHKSIETKNKQKLGIALLQRASCVYNHTQKPPITPRRPDGGAARGMLLCVSRASFFGFVLLVWLFGDILMMILMMMMRRRRKEKATYTHTHAYTRHKNTNKLYGVLMSADEKKKTVHGTMTFDVLDPPK
jgi:hypothetical protein